MKLQRRKKPSKVHQVKSDEGTESEDGQLWSVHTLKSLASCEESVVNANLEGNGVGMEFVTGVAHTLTPKRQFEKRLPEVKLDNSDVC